MKSDYLAERSRAFLLLITIALAVSFYWLGFFLTVYNSQEGLEYFVSSYSVNPHEQPQAEVFSGPMEQVEGGYDWQTCAKPCAFFARFEIPASDFVGDWGFVPSYNTDNYAVFVDGVRVAVQGALLPEPSFHGKRSWLTRIPRALINPQGVTQVDLVMVRWAEPASIRGAFIGPYPQLAQALDVRFFMYYEWPAYMAIGGLALGLIGLVVLPLARNRAMFFWFSVVAVSWALLGLFRLWFDFPFSNDVRALYYFVLLNLVYLALFNFFDLWSGQNSRVQRFSASALYLGLLGIYLLLGTHVDNNDKEALLGDPYQLLLSIGLVIKATRHYFVENESRVVESAAIFIALSAALLDVLAQAFGIFDFYSLARTLPIFVFAVAASLYYRNATLYESARSINEVLSAELASKERALQESYERDEKVRQAKVLLEERQRILQDMHDGVGGRLSALLQTQQNKSDADEDLTRELRQSLQDLLLIIDSLDPDLNEQLGSALGVLRTRLTPWLKSHELKLVWDVELPGDLGLGPERTLHVYRCLQEAISNVVRHAQASEVVISACERDDQVEISVSDDGVGIDLDGRQGRGLSGMRNRMASIGGVLEIKTNPVTTVIFSFPKARNQQGE